MAFGAKTDHGGSSEPFDMVPDILTGFCEKEFGVTPSMIAAKMETYILSGGA